VSRRHSINCELSESMGRTLGRELRYRNSVRNWAVTNSIWTVGQRLSCPSHGSRLSSSVEVMDYLKVTSPQTSQSEASFCISQHRSRIGAYTSCTCPFKMQKSQDKVPGAPSSILDYNSSWKKSGHRGVGWGARPQRPYAWYATDLYQYRS